MADLWCWLYTAPQSASVGQAGNVVVVGQDRGFGLIILRGHSSLSERIVW